MTSLLIKNAVIITVDGSNRVFRRGGLVVEDGEITYVGKSDEALKIAGRVEFRIDGEGSVVTPGFINTHVHPAQALLRSLVPDNVRLIEWLKDWVWPLQGSFRDRDGVVAAELCMLEMLRTGTTAFLATSMHKRYNIDGVAESVLKSGIRGVLAKQTMDVPDYALKKGVLHPGMVEDREESLTLFKQLFKRWDGRENRLWIWLSPRTPGAVSDDLFREIARLKREYNSGVTMHLAEVKEDIEYFRSRGTKPGRFVHELGLTGPKSVFVHCVWLDDDDITLFSRTNTSVSHNPTSNSKLASGVAPVYKMIRSGVNVCLGTDGGPSNDSYDMVREMKTAVLLQKLYAGDPASITLTDALRMATINGAKALGLDRIIGSIEPGKRGDIVVFNFREPHLTPSLAHESNLVYSASGHDVEYVFVDGRIVVERGRVLTLDEESVLEEAQRRALDLYERVKGSPWWS